MPGGGRSGLYLVDGDGEEPFAVRIWDRGECRVAVEKPTVYGTYGGGYRVPIDDVRRQVADRVLTQQQVPLEDDRAAIG